MRHYKRHKSNPRTLRKNSSSDNNVAHVSKTP